MDALQFRASIEKNYGKENNKDNALNYYLKALQIYQDHIHQNISVVEKGINNKAIPPYSKEVVSLLKIANQAIGLAFELKNIEKAKHISEIAEKAGGSHQTNIGIQLLGEIYHTYGMLLKDSKQYENAIFAFRREFKISESAWKQAPWHWYLRYNLGVALQNLIGLYQKIEAFELYNLESNKEEKIKPLALEIEASKAWLELWGSPMLGIETSQFLSINPQSPSDGELKKLREVTSIQNRVYMANIQYILNGKEIPANIPIMDVMWPKDPLEDQIRTIEESSGGKVTGFKIELYRKLYKAAHENQVSFIDLIQYLQDGVLKKGDNKVHNIVYEATKDEYAAILLQGNNENGEKIYSYVRVQLLNIKKLYGALASGKDFSPSDFGQIIAAGKGEPPEDVKAKMDLAGRKLAPLSPASFK